MRFTQMHAGAVKTQRIDGFGGYWPQDTAGQTQWYRMQNLCGDGYPHLTTRPPRTKVGQCALPDGLHGGERLLWADGGQLYYNGAYMGRVREGEKQFVQMGARILILPDKLVFDTQALTIDPVECSFSTVGNADIRLCAQDGSDLGEMAVGATAPAEPADGALWLDTAAVPNRLMQYSVVSLCWVVRSDTAIHIASEGIGALFGAGDGVDIADCIQAELNGSHVLLDCGPDFVRIRGILPQAVTQDTPLRISRTMPDLDFAVELNNRIWGCNSQKREIYACALGDPFNWNVFAGTAADSYSLTVGSLGDFTGAAVYQGAVLFFKEHCVHKLLGSKPANFQLTTVPMEGPMRGAHKTLALAGGYLLYQAPDGIRIYGSSGSDNISGSWAVAQAGCAGAMGSKYYLYLPGQGVLCYDTLRGLWHREDDTAVKQFAAWNGGLYMLTADGGIWCADGWLHDIDGAVYTPEGDIAWMAESGEIAVTLDGGRYVRGLALRVQLSAGSTLTVDVCYDDSDTYTQVYHIAAAGKRSYRLPILPRLAHSMRIRLSGQGAMKLVGMQMRVMEV